MSLISESVVDHLIILSLSLTAPSSSFLTFFSISYCLMLIPSQVIITYVRPSYWLPGLEIGWGFVTALIALARDARHVYILRVLLGLFESSAWPGMMTLFSMSSAQFYCTVCS